MDGQTDGKRKKRGKIIIIILIILLLLLMLIKLFFEFRAERQRIFDLRAQKLALETDENARLRALIDSLCIVYPDDCDKFKTFLNINDLRTYADSLTAARSETDESDESARLRSLIDSLCLVYPDDCERFKKFSDIDGLMNFANSLAAQLAAKRAAEAQTRAERDAAAKARADSIARENVEKSRREADSLAALAAKRAAEAQAKAEKEAAQKEACKDTAAIWVYPEPGGGLHFGPIRVRFFVSRPVSVFYKRSAGAQFRLWGGEDILISQNTELFYKASDNCGNEFAEQKKVFEFREKQAQNVCPDNMSLIESFEPRFCMDQYLWPNRQDARPTNMVTQAQARDSCAAIGKRLCSAQEWTAACRGPSNFRFPYGDAYASWACVTQDSVSRRSGAARACRSWYGLYDLSGNLAEWTSTRAPANNRFFLVKGGFWESGHTADCLSSRYSYHPQNRHNPVGFRCCKSLD